MNHDPAARLIARLLAFRCLPREDGEVRRLLVDAAFREDVERRLAESGLRLLAHPFAAHVAFALTRESESAVFEQGNAWQASNVGLDKDAMALLVILWALIILPKRERQLSSEAAQPEETQSDLFGSVKLTPAARDASRGIPQNTLQEDYGKLLGGKTRMNFALSQLSRQNFIEIKNKVIHEGPLLDLAFDYAEMAPRILQGALSDILKQRGVLQDSEEI